MRDPIRFVPPLLFALGASVACGGDDDQNNNSRATPAEQRAQYDQCVRDGDAYTPFEGSISTTPRVEAFETIADQLWRASDAPDSAAFDNALETYLAQEGLQSRVSRREDERQAPVTRDGEPVKCGDLADEDLDPARCVGPAQIGPLLNDAFEQGGAGIDPAINAARVEAGLLWFFYISSYKEAVTCAEKRRDCDSSWAYYNGARPPGAGIGLSSYVREAALPLDEAVGDAHTALSCWRTTDAALVAENGALHADALARLEASLDDGFAAVIKARAEAARTAAVVSPGADWTFVEITGRALLFAYNERLPEQAFAFEAALDLGAPTSEQEWDAITAAIDAFLLAPAPQLAGN